MTVCMQQCPRKISHGVWDVGCGDAYSYQGSAGQIDGACVFNSTLYSRDTSGQCSYIGTRCRSEGLAGPLQGGVPTICGDNGVNVPASESLTYTELEAAGGDTNCPLLLADRAGLTTSDSSPSAIRKLSDAVKAGNFRVTCQPWECDASGRDCFEDLEVNGEIVEVLGNTLTFDGGESVTFTVALPDIKTMAKACLGYIPGGYGFGDWTINCGDSFDAMCRFKTAEKVYDNQRLDWQETEGARCVPIGLGRPIITTSSSTYFGQPVATTRTTTTSTTTTTTSTTTGYELGCPFFEGSPFQQIMLTNATERGWLKATCDEVTVLCSVKDCKVRNSFGFCPSYLAGKGGYTVAVEKDANDNPRWTIRDSAGDVLKFMPAADVDIQEVIDACSGQCQNSRFGTRGVIQKGCGQAYNGSCSLKHEDYKVVNNDETGMTLKECEWQDNPCNTLKRACDKGDAARSRAVAAEQRPTSFGSCKPSATSSTGYTCVDTPPPLSAICPLSPAFSMRGQLVDAAVDGGVSSAAIAEVQRQLNGLCLTGTTLECSPDKCDSTSSRCFSDRLHIQLGVIPGYFDVKDGYLRITEEVTNTVMSQVMLSEMPSVNGFDGFSGDDTEDMKRIVEACWWACPGAEIKISPPTCQVSGVFTVGQGTCTFNSKDYSWSQSTSSDPERRLTGPSPSPSPSSFGPSPSPSSSFGHSPSPSSSFGHSPSPSSSFFPSPSPSSSPFPFPSPSSSSSEIVCTEITTTTTTTSTTTDFTLTTSAAAGTTTTTQGRTLAPAPLVSSGSGSFGASMDSYVKQQSSDLAQNLPDVDVSGELGPDSAFEVKTPVAEVETSYAVVTVAKPGLKKTSSASGKERTVLVESDGVLPISLPSSLTQGRSGVAVSVMKMKESGLWMQDGEDFSKCSGNIDDAGKGLLLKQCQELAESRNHTFFSYSGDEDGQSKCVTTPTCDSRVRGTGWDWKIYSKAQPRYTQIERTAHCCWNRPVARAQQDNIANADLETCYVQCTANSDCRYISYNADERLCALCSSCDVKNPMGAYASYHKQAFCSTSSSCSSGETCKDTFCQDTNYVTEDVAAASPQPGEVKLTHQGKEVVLAAPVIDLTVMDANGVLPASDVSNLDEPIVFQATTRALNPGSTCAYLQADGTWSQEGVSGATEEQMKAAFGSYYNNSQSWSTAGQPTGFFCATTHLSIFGAFEGPPVEVVVPEKECPWILGFDAVDGCDPDIGTTVFLYILLPIIVIVILILCFIFRKRICKCPVGKAGRLILADKEGELTAVQFKVDDKAKADKNGKKHIVWEVDVEAASQKKYEYEGTSSKGKDAPLWSSRGLQSNNSSLAVQGVQCPQCGLMTSDLEKHLAEYCQNVIKEDTAEAQPDAPVICEAYGIEMPIEYYSDTNEKWVAGYIEGPGGLLTSEDAYPVYNVILRSFKSQRRDCVAVTSMRLPFNEGDLVKFLVPGSNDDDDWAVGTVKGKDWYPLPLGYDIEPEGDSALVKCPAECVRPHFPAGAQCAVYTGIQKGWCTGVVKSPLDQMGRITVLVDGSGSDEQKEQVVTAYQVRPKTDERIKEMMKLAKTAKKK
eukprot:TRINITY_DN10150_c0_g1_i2.p1 TRINITY_DN10150_c0_g1~~TRINITY_DN10150_c0_g1_i2.p1  ORF type:complete len:1745 (+),score=253.58 TRINITY_DN10150_c0_g1_i2:513-5237(+)